MKTKINGLNAIVEGEGKVLLFLHGYLSNKESFLRQISYFSNYFKVVAFDQCGFASQQMPYPYSLEDYKNSLNAVINELGVSNLNVVAHSFGVRVLMKALPENDNIDKIVITGSAGLKPRKSFLTRLKIAKYKLVKKFVSADKLKNYGSSDYQMLSGVMRESFLKIVNEHVDKRLKDIDNQTLIIQGENDRETPLYMAKRYNKLLKNSSLCIIKNAGHFAFVDKPNEFNILAKEFLI